MHPKAKSQLLYIAAAALLAVSCGGSKENPAPAAKAIRIAVIPKGSTHEF